MTKTRDTRTMKQLREENEAQAKLIKKLRKQLRDARFYSHGPDGRRNPCWERGIHGIPFIWKGKYACKSCQRDVPKYARERRKVLEKLDRKSA